MTSARSTSPIQPKRARLPTLQEVLSRNTRPPVDLYCYYLFLQREGAEDTLDFWLDVHQHENLVRAYFKDLSKTGRTVKDEWPNYYEIAKRRGSAWNNINGVTSDADKDEQEPSQLHLDRVDVNNDQVEPERIERNALSAEDAAQQLDVDQARKAQRTPSPTSNGPRPNFAANFSPTLRALYPHDRDMLTPSPTASNAVSTAAGVVSSTANSISHKRRSMGAASGTIRGKQSTTMPYIPRDTAITRTDLIASAERIYARYLMAGAEKEIYLPNVLRVTNFPISSSQLPHVYNEPNFELENDTLARIPDMFHAQKEWVYRAMEQDSFPRFLRSKAFGNLTPISAMIRLVLGLLVMWVALSVSFVFIFLDIQPKSRRLWVSAQLSIQRWLKPVLLLN